MQQAQASSATEFVQLTMTAGYCPTWGLWEGIRELVQNGKDAETQYGAALTVTHTGKCLRIKNVGTTLNRSALLLGQTSKTDDRRLIGQFGEGLKVGCLALARQNVKVRIFTGNEEWIPYIGRSQEFNADLLYFAITPNPYSNSVTVEVEITAEQWAEFFPRFLFLQDISGYSVPCDYGDLLLDPNLAGCLFVKGVYISYDKALKYGYNFTTDVEINRDRAMIESWNKRWSTARIWNLVAGGSEEKEARRNELFAMLAGDDEDVRGMEYYVDHMLEELREDLADKFEQVYGKGACAVRSHEEAKKIEHFGKIGVVSSGSMYSVVSSVRGSTQQILQKLDEEAAHYYSWHDLDAEESRNLNEAVELVEKAVKKLNLDMKSLAMLDSVQVVDFRSGNYLGQFKDGKAFLAKKILKDPNQTLITLIHEISHLWGADGEFGHVHQLQEIWGSLSGDLRDRIKELAYYYKG